MATTYPVYTVVSGSVEKGAVVRSLTLKGSEVIIPAIFVGSRGRGRHEDILAVDLPDTLKAAWQEKGEVRVCAGSIGKTKSGKWKLFASEEASSNQKFVAVLLTGMGFRGGNSHTGDRAGWKCEKYSCKAAGEGSVPDSCPECNGTGSYDGPKLQFAPFPGDVLAEGTIAQGDAGRMGSGQQLIAVINRDVYFRTGYSGRLYGGPSAHYYVFDGNIVASMTWEARQAAATAQADEDDVVEFIDDTPSAPVPSALTAEGSMAAEMVKAFRQAGIWKE